MNSLRGITARKGVFLRSEALEAGLDDRALSRLRRSGEIVRVRHGVYVFGDDWRCLDERGKHQRRTWAAIRASGRPAAASHISAVLEHVPSYWGLDLERPHLTRLDSRGSGRTSGIVQHRGLVAPGDIVPAGNYLVTSAPRAALEVTTVASVEAALVSVNAILHAGLCSESDIRDRYSRAIDHWPHTLGTNVVLHLMDRRIESVGESRTLHMLWRGGLPLPVPQFEVVTAQGVLLARLDFAWPDLGVFLEFDGKAKYQSLLREGEDPADIVFREKQREDLVRRVTGWRCIRITWADLERPEATLAMIRRELAAAAA